MNARMLVLLLAIPANSAIAGDAGVVLLYRKSGDTHCYRIVNESDKPLKELSVGSSWDGHPIPDTVELSLTDKPGGWTAKHEVRSRYGYQFVMLTAPSMATDSKVFPKGYLGRVCLKLGAAVTGMDTLPFAWQPDGYPNRLLGRATADDGRVLRLFDAKEFDKDALEAADDAIDTVKDAGKTLDRLKDLF